MQLIGKISGDVKPTEFNVILSDSAVEKGSYVKINHEQYGWVLARIEHMKRYLDNDGNEILMSQARTIGYKSGDNVLIPKTPFGTEERVYSADRDLIMTIIGLRTKKSNNLYLGLLDGHNIPVYLDIHLMINKHMSVLAKTGAGKSYTVGVILEELIKNGISIVIIDPHGEYSSLKHENDDYDSMLTYGVKPRSYLKNITEYTANILVNPDAKKLTLKPKFTLEELTEIMPMKLGDQQKSILYSALKRIERHDYTLQDLINVVRLDDSKAKWKVINGLDSLRSSGIFEGAPVKDKDLVKKGHASIVNLKGAEPQIQELIVAKLAKDLFNAKKLNEISNFFFLVEEAHNFCPERGFGDALSSQILRTIASEGRKFGFHLCVVSQRPARIDKNVLSQCNTQIILKVTNPNDLRAIGQSIEGFTPGMENDIRELSVGQALVVGECVEQPIIVNIRVRESKHGSAMIETEDEDAKEKEKEKDKTIIGKIKPVFLKDEEEVERDRKERKERREKNNKEREKKEEEKKRKEEEKKEKEKKKREERNESDGNQANNTMKKTLAERLKRVFLRDAKENDPVD